MQLFLATFVIFAFFFTIGSSNGDTILKEVLSKMFSNLNGKEYHLLDNKAISGMKDVFVDKKTQEEKARDDYGDVSKEVNNFIDDNSNKNVDSSKESVKKKGKKPDKRSVRGPQVGLEYKYNTLMKKVTNPSQDSDYDEDESSEDNEKEGGDECSNPCGDKVSQEIEGQVLEGIEQVLPAQSKAAIENRDVLWFGLGAVNFKLLPSEEQLKEVIEAVKSAEGGRGGFAGYHTWIFLLAIAIIGMLIFMGIFMVTNAYFSSQRKRRLQRDESSFFRAPSSMSFSSD